MMIPSLQTHGLFLAHCRIEPEAIHAGIVVMKGYGLVGEVVSLVSSDDFEGDRYTVRVPAIAYNPEYNVVLERIL